MAILTFPAIPDDLLNYKPGHDVNSYFRIASAISATDTRIVALSSSEIYVSGVGYVFRNADVTLEGSFAFGPLSTISGTIDRISIGAGGTPFLTVTDIGADAARIWAAMSSVGGALPEILTGDDTITGSETRDTLRGFGGDDRISGLRGNDWLYGDGGDDLVFGGDLRDYMEGGDGRDRLSGGGGQDRIQGGADRDILKGNHGDDSLSGDKGNDRLEGGRGDDYLDGRDGNDRLFGGDGDDDIHGHDGRDTIIGDAGNDRIEGGRGSDTLTGGDGDDVFVFQYFSRTQKKGGPGQDTITDFAPGDRIGLGYVTKVADLTITQVGSDVTIALNKSLITVLDATLAEVTAGLETASYWYYG